MMDECRTLDYGGGAAGFIQIPVADLSIPAEHGPLFLSVWLTGGGGLGDTLGVFVTTGNNPPPVPAATEAVDCLLAISSPSQQSILGSSADSPVSLPDDFTGPLWVYMPEQANNYSVTVRVYEEIVS